MEISIFHLPFENCKWYLLSSFGHGNNLSCQLKYDGTNLVGFYQSEKETVPIIIDHNSSMYLSCNFITQEGINPGQHYLELDFYINRAILDTGGYTMYTKINQCDLYIDTRRFYLEGHLSKGYYNAQICRDKIQEEDVTCNSQPLEQLMKRLSAIESK